MPVGCGIDRTNIAHVERAGPGAGALGARRGFGGVVGAYMVFGHPCAKRSNGGMVGGFACGGEVGTTTELDDVPRCERPGSGAGEGEQ